MRVFNAKFFFIFFTLCLFSIKGQAQEGNSDSVGPGNYIITCYGGKLGYGDLYCPVPGAGVAYESTSNLYSRYFIVKGMMSLFVSPKDLVGRPITVKVVGNYLDVNIYFWDQITGEKVAWFFANGVVCDFTDFGDFIFE